jgi:2-polyprenyl-3-methyl-5-hydroxy-6-metoxy-1,4-benzoquinol methylase
MTTEPSEIFANPATLRCPVCGSPCHEPPWREYGIEEAARHFCPEIRDANRYRRLRDCIARLWNDRPCRVLHCSNCGFGFADPFVGGDEEFYSILHEQQGYPGWRWDYDVAIEHASITAAGGRILDIGAGSGVFLQGLSSNWNKFAVEGSATTRGILSAKGIEVFESLAAAETVSAASFDVITLFQVLEHMAQFEEVLRLSRSLAKAGAMIVITVPDAAAMRQQEELTGCADMPPNHVCKWTPKSIFIALEKAGFSVRHVIYEPASFAAFRSAVHLRILADREKRGSLARQIYRIKSKVIRSVCLAVLAVPTGIRFAGALKRVSTGGAFAVIANAETDTQ